MACIRFPESRLQMTHCNEHTLSIRLRRLLNDIVLVPTEDISTNFTGHGKKSLYCHPILIQFLSADRLESACSVKDRPVELKSNAAVRKGNEPANNLKQGYEIHTSRISLPRISLLISRRSCNDGIVGKISRNCVPDESTIFPRDKCASHQPRFPKQ